jgi:hypothetical protein
MNLKSQTEKLENQSAIAKKIFEVVPIQGAAERAMDRQRLEARHEQHAGHAHSRGLPRYADGCRSDSGAEEGLFPARAGSGSSC